MFREGRNQTFGLIRFSVSLQEVEECLVLLQKESVALSPQLGSLRFVPLHSGLAGLAQRVYESGPGAEPKDGNPSEGDAGGGVRRKVILCDTLGEASFSLQGVRYVVDTGLQLKTVSSGGEPWDLGRVVLNQKLLSVRLPGLQPSDPGQLPGPKEHQPAPGGHEDPAGQQPAVR